MTSQIEEYKSALAKALNIIEKSQSVLCDYLPPDSNITTDDVVSNLLGILDNADLVEFMQSANRMVK